MVDRGLSCSANEGDFFWLLESEQGVCVNLGGELEEVLQTTTTNLFRIEWRLNEVTTFRFFGSCGCVSEQWAERVAAIIIQWILGLSSQGRREEEEEELQEDILTTLSELFPTAVR